MLRSQQLDDAVYSLPIFNNWNAPLSLSLPVIRRENGIHFLAFFIFAYDECLNQGGIRRPEYWLLCDLETSDLKELRACRKTDFMQGDKDYERLYSTAMEKPLSDNYYEVLYRLLDAVRTSIIHTKVCDKSQYQGYLQMVLASTPPEYRRFYEGLTNM